MRLLTCWLVLLMLVVTGCDDDAPISPPVNETEVPDPGSDVAEVPVASLTPTPITVTLADLPAPYHTPSASRAPNVVPVPATPVLNVPEGFRVNVYAEGLTAPRWLALTPEGDVLVAESGSDRIRRLRDTDGNGAADLVTTYGVNRDGLSRPFGMVFVGGDLYVANQNGLRRYDDAARHNTLPNDGTVLATYPSSGHWTRSLAVSPDSSQLFIGIGSRSNIDIEDTPRASVQVIGLDGSGLRTWADGLRNPVGLAFHPTTGALYTVVNERDRLGDDLVPDYFTRIQEGDFFGWPYTYLAPDNLDPRRMDGDVSENPTLAAQTQTPDLLFQAHSAPLGLVFYDGTAFPEHYRGGAFAAFHGSWNRNAATGYKVVFLPFDANGQPTGSYEDFLTGFVLDDQAPTVWGRPTGLLILPDGSMLLTDDGNGRIYRIRYAP